MVNCNNDYPFPVLRPFPKDYKTSVFRAEIEVIPGQEGYAVNTNLVVDNEVIRFLVNNGLAQAGILVQCDSTWLRDIQPVTLGTDSFVIATSDVHHRVQLCPVITAMQDIDNLASADLEDEYQDVRVVIHPGDPLAIGDTKFFDAIYEEDKIRKGDPIISITTDPNTKDMYFDFEHDVILVYVPANVKNAYSSITTVVEKKWVMGMIFYLPAVTEAIRVLGSKEKDDYIDKAWAATILQDIEILADGNKDKMADLKQHPFQTAQKIFNGMDRAILDLDAWIVTRA